MSLPQEKLVTDLGTTSPASIFTPCLATPQACSSPSKPLALHLQTSLRDLQALECPRSTPPLPLLMLHPIAPPFPKSYSPSKPGSNPAPPGGLDLPGSALCLQAPDPTLFQSLHWHLSASQNSTSLKFREIGPCVSPEPAGSGCLRDSLY